MLNVRSLAFFADDPRIELRRSMCSLYNVVFFLHVAFAHVDTSKISAEPRLLRAASRFTHQSCDGPISERTVRESNPRPSEGRDAKMHLTFFAVPDLASSNEPRRMTYEREHETNSHASRAPGLGFLPLEYPWATRLLTLLVHAASFGKRSSCRGALPARAV